SRQRATAQLSTFAQGFASHSPEPRARPLVATGWHEEGQGDCAEAMWQLLIPLALWLSTVGLSRAELTAIQHRGLQVALEEFHRHPPVQWAFRETGVDSATETPFPAGTFVRLEFNLQQTSCRKKDWKKAECKVKPNGVSEDMLCTCLRVSERDGEHDASVCDWAFQGDSRARSPEVGAASREAEAAQSGPGCDGCGWAGACPGRTAECWATLRTHRKRKCLACIKLDSANKVLGRMVHCPIQTQVQQELEERQEAQCGRVERTGEDPHSYYFPGQFSQLPGQLWEATSARPPSCSSTQGGQSHSPRANKAAL
ncbi:hypothetical protein MC885_018219, partial [Smutsia gigantea]